jgi:hypothetical protein
MNATMTTLQIAIGLTALIALSRSADPRKLAPIAGCPATAHGRAIVVMTAAIADITAMVRVRAIPAAAIVGAAAVAAVAMEVVAGTAVVEATSGATANNGNRSYASAAAVLDSF